MSTRTVSREHAYVLMPLAANANCGDVPRCLCHVQCKEQCTGPGEVDQKEFMNAVRRMNPTMEPFAKDMFSSFDHDKEPSTPDLPRAH